MAEYNKVCETCGVPFVARGNTARFCPGCAKKRTQESKNKSKLKAWEEGKIVLLPKQEQKKPEYSFKPKKCPEDCAYLRILAGTPMCGYFLETDELRGCDPGLGCNKYVGKNEDLKAAKHRKVTWDVVNGKKLWEAGWKDSMIAKVMRVKTDTVKSYRKRVWEKEEKHGELNPLTCERCGGPIDRKTMKCPYCDTQYERTNTY